MIGSLSGGVLGLLVGDALGVPYEFHAPQSIPPAAHIEMTPPPGFRRAHEGTPVGTWSDDGAQALCLLASLLERDRFDADDFAAKIVAWHDKGYLAVDNRVFDVGITTSQAIARLKRGAPALEAGLRDEYDNGNGSLMRVLPLALWHRGDDAELCRLAMLQSRVTHGHLRSQICCALYCLWAREELRAAPDAFSRALARFRAIFPDATPERRELEAHVRPDDGANISGSGYVVDSLRSAVWACEGESYEDVVRRAISLGKDTDTTACIAGGIAGLRWGVEGIPQRWRDALRGMDVVAPLLAGLEARG